LFNHRLTGLAQKILTGFYTAESRFNNRRFLSMYPSYPAGFPTPNSQAFPPVGTAPQGGGYSAPPPLYYPQPPQPQTFSSPLSPQGLSPGMPYFGQTPGPSADIQSVRSGKPAAHGPLKFGFEPCSTAACCCIVPAAVGGLGLVWALKNVIGKVFGALKGIAGGIGNIAKKGASAVGEAAGKG
jgi:hypothetical protein